MKNTGLEKILGRIEDLDSVNLGILVQRLARERKLQETVFNTIRDGILVIDLARSGTIFQRRVTPMSFPFRPTITA